MQSILVNFNAPEITKRRFDEICQATGKTRTAVLVELMEQYILSQGAALVSRSEEFRVIDDALAEIRKVIAHRKSLYDPAGGEQLMLGILSDDHSQDMTDWSAGHW